MSDANGSGGGDNRMEQLLHEAIDTQEKLIKRSRALTDKVWQKALKAKLKQFAAEGRFQLNGVVPPNQQLELFKTVIAEVAEEVGAAHAGITTRAVRVGGKVGRKRIGREDRDDG